MKDVFLKSELLKTGQVHEYDQAHKEAWLGNAEPLKDFADVYGERIMKLCKSITKSTLDKRKRCKAKVASVVEAGQAYFLTLTFDDFTLENTTPFERRVMVSRQLKEISDTYIANIDYGSEQHREHYHAILYGNNLTKQDLAWWTTDGVGKKAKHRHVGFVDLRKVGSEKDDIEKVTKYTAKLSAHALKNTTPENPLYIPRLIYSRGKGKVLPPAWLLEPDN